MRSEFPIFETHPNLLYLDSAATTHKPRSVIEALRRFYAEEYGTVHRAIYRGAALATAHYEAAREKARMFLHAADVEEIVFTRGTTDGLNLVARSWGKTNLKPGDEIALSELEHHSNLVPWQMIAKETGATLRWIPSDAAGQLQWRDVLNPKTKLIAVAHMSNVTGLIHPIEEIGAVAHLHGAIVVVDGAQAAPHLPINVQKLGCDFYTFSGHKCYGPTGIGILYGKKHLLESMPPIQGGGDMIHRVDLHETTYAAPPLRFEAGTPLIASAIGLKPALEFLESVELDRIEKQENILLEAMEEALHSVEGLRILGDGKRGPLLTFSIAGVHSLDLATWLDSQEIAIRSGHLCAQPALRKFGLEGASRISFGLYNTLEEVERAGEAIRRGVAKLR